MAFGKKIRLRRRHCSDHSVSAFAHDQGTNNFGVFQIRGGGHCCIGLGTKRLGKYLNLYMISYGSSSPGRFPEARSSCMIFKIFWLHRYESFNARTSGSFLKRGCSRTAWPARFALATVNRNFGFVSMQFARCFRTH